MNKRLVAFIAAMTLFLIIICFAILNLNENNLNENNLNKELIKAIQTKTIPVEVFNRLSVANQKEFLGVGGVITYGK